MCTEFAHVHRVHTRAQCLSPSLLTSHPRKGICSQDEHIWTHENHLKTIMYPVSSGFHQKTPQTEGGAEGLNSRTVFPAVWSWKSEIRCPRGQVLERAPVWLTDGRLFPVSSQADERQCGRERPRWSSPVSPALYDLMQPEGPRKDGESHGELGLQLWNLGRRTQFCP